MAEPTEEQKRQLDRKFKRIESHRRAITSRKRTVKGIGSREFHDILDKASQPIEKSESDQEQS